MEHAKKETKKKLTLKQQKWIIFYKQGKDQTEAARLAGYKGSNLSVIGSQNLMKLKDYIIDRDTSITDPLIADMVEINRFWTTTMRSSEADPKDRLKSSELLAKVQGAFIEKIESKTDSKITIELLGDSKDWAV